MGSKKRSKPEKYKMQKLRTSANKRKAWREHMEQNPNDKEGKARLEALLKGD